MDQKQTKSQQNWKEGQTPHPQRNPAERLRQTPGSTERGPTTERGGGSEMEEQEELPDRSSDQSDR